MWDPIQQWKCREMPGKGSSVCNENCEEPGMQTDTQLESQAEKWLTSWGNGSFGDGKFRVWVWKEGRETAKQPIAIDGNRNSKTNWNEGTGQQLRYQSCNIIMSVCFTPTAQSKQELNLLSPSWQSSLPILQINKPPNARHTQIFIQNQTWELWALGTSFIHRSGQP